MGKHAKYSPSKLSRIITCPASGKYEDSGKSSSYADEGSMLHEVTERCLLAHFNGEDWQPKLALAGLTRDQRDVVEECVLYAIDLHSQLGEPNNVEYMVEFNFTIAEDCSGTADLVLFNHKELHVIDWKFGQGVEVSANENPQLMAYAIGALNYLGVHNDIAVTMHVVQPRLNNFDTYCSSKNNLDRWYRMVLLEALDAANSDDPKFNPTLEACRWCPAKGFCSARMAAAVDNAATVFAEHAKLPEIDMDNFGLLLNMAQEIEACIKDLKAHAQHLLMAGKEVKGFKMVAGRSTRVWADENAAVDFLESRVDPEQMYNTKLVSPAQAEKLLDREDKKSEDFQALVYKPPGKPTLAPESDKRKPLSLDACSVFANHAQ